MTNEILINNCKNYIDVDLSYEKIVSENINVIQHDIDKQENIEYVDIIVRQKFCKNKIPLYIDEISLVLEGEDILCEFITETLSSSIDLLNHEITLFLHVTGVDGVGIQFNEKFIVDALVGGLDCIVKAVITIAEYRNLEYLDSVLLTTLMQLDNGMLLSSFINSRIALETFIRNEPNLYGEDNPDYKTGFNILMGRNGGVIGKIYHDRDETERRWFEDFNIKLNYFRNKLAHGNEISDDIKERLSPIDIETNLKILKSLQRCSNGFLVNQLNRIVNDWKQETEINEEKILSPKWKGERLCYKEDSDGRVNVVFW